MKLFVLDTHTIYRRGLVACLDLLEEVESVAEAERVRDAWEHPALFATDLVLMDPALPGGGDFVAAVREATGARVIVCASDSGQDAAISALQAGAVGYLPKAELTPETLASAVRAAANGSSVMTPDLLGHLLAKLPESARLPSRRGTSHRPRAAGPDAHRRRASDPRSGARALLLRAHRQERAARRRDQAQRAQPLTGGRLRRSRGSHLKSRRSGREPDKVPDPDLFAC